METDSQLGWNIKRRMDGRVSGVGERGEEVGDWVGLGLHN